MDSFFFCIKCGHKFSVKDEVAGKEYRCPACEYSLDVGHMSAHKEMQAPEGECSQCGNVFGLDKLFEHRGRQICARCLHIVQRKHLARMKRTKRLAIQLIVVVILVAGFFAFKIYYWDCLYPYEITDIDGSMSSSGNFGFIELSVEEVNQSRKEDYDGYALIFAIDSEEKMSELAEKLIKESRTPLTQTRTDYLARWWCDGVYQQCFVGRFGDGGLEWLDSRRRYRLKGATTHRYIDPKGKMCSRQQWLDPEVPKCGSSIDGVGIHAIVYLGKEPLDTVKLNLVEDDFGVFKVKDKCLVRAQVWACTGKDWKAVSRVCKREYEE